MGSTLAIVIPVLLGAFGIGVLWLWAKDRVYTSLTGKPASERVRERNERLSGPISRGQYLGRSFLLGAIILVLLYESSWTHYHYYKGWARAIPLAWAVSASFSFCCKSSGANNNDRSRLTRFPLSSPAGKVIPGPGAHLQFRAIHIHFNFVIAGSFRVAWCVRQGIL